MEKNQNISLFSDSKADNEESDNKTKTLFITLNGKKVEMPIEEIFDPSRFNSIKAVTYSADEKFINKICSNFEKVDIIIGIQNEQVQLRGLKAFTANAVNYLREDPVEFLENLNNGNKKKLVNRTWTIRVPISATVHSKFYILQGETESRIILGSANMSENAFSEKSNQFENIAIFDNSEMLDTYLEYFELINSRCIDFVGKMLLEKAKAKLERKKNEKAGNQEINITFNHGSERDEARLLVSEDFSEGIEKAVKELTADLNNEEAKNETDEARYLEQSLLEKGRLEKEEKEKTIYAVRMVEAAFNKRSRKKENFINSPETYKKAVKKIMEVRTAIKVTEDVAERKKLILREQDMGNGHSGLFLIKEDDTAVPFGQEATESEIKASIENFYTLIENYKKFTFDYDDDYGSLIMENILYAFTSPFVQSIRKKLKSSALEISPFYFVGGAARSGKSKLMDITVKLMGIEKQKLIYNNIVGNKKDKKKAAIMTQIESWMYEDNVLPLMIDEIDEDFFRNKKRGNELITNVSTVTAESLKMTPCFIGNTNASEFLLPERAARRSIYIQNSHKFKKEMLMESTEAFDELFDKLDDSLFNDFVIRFAEKLSDDETEWKNYSGNSNVLDFLYWTREIFKEYFKIAGKEIPKWFPVEKKNTILEMQKNKWKDLYRYEPEKFKLALDEDEKCYLFKLTDLNVSTKTSGDGMLKSEEYFEILDDSCRAKEDKDFVRIKIIEFHKWIGIPIPKELKKKIYGGKNILSSIFKRKKS